ncbi:unnamed protein product [Schistosoma turkestanicum]|nr:unnamed protein product [Schistosoma turkestanicum]
MIPQTVIQRTYARVPPIYTSNCQKLQTPTTGSNLALQNTVSSKRGRRSNVPPEIREQTRRLKKQNMERRRRACISDKMNALHNLAMNLIGIDPNECHKVEKADILNLCHSVFKGIANIAKDEPEIQTRLRKLRHNLMGSSSCTTSMSHESTSSFNERKCDNDKPCSQNKKIQEENQFQENKEPHLEHHHHHHLYSNNTISLSSTPTLLATPIPCGDKKQHIDESNKENKIPKLIIKNPLSFKNYPMNDCNQSSIIKTPTSLSMNPIYSHSIIHSQNNNETTTQWQSTPLQYLNKLNSTLNNSDSGFVNNSNQSIELTPHRKKVPICKEHHFNELTTDSTESSALLNYSNGKNLPSWSSSSSSSSKFMSEEHLSAFSVPVRKPLTVITNQSIHNHYHRDQKSSTMDSTIPTSTSTSESTITPIRNIVKPMWRPYLD